MRRNAKKNALRTPLIFAAIVIAAVVLVSLFVGSSADAKMASDFVRKASIGNEFEIASSQLALQKSHNDQVRQFAQHMIDDHAKAGQDLNSVLAAAPNANVPYDVQIDRKHQNLLDDLSKASQSDFDKKYVKDQVKAHDEAVDLFKTYASHGDNPALKSFAARTLPTLQSHQRDIQQISSSL